MEKFVPETRTVPVEFDPFAGPVIQRTVPSTEPQREVFVASLMDEDASCAYNESVTLVLEGPLDRPRLEQALHALVKRHEGLRSVMSANGLRTIVMAEGTLAIGHTDLSGRADQQEALDAYAASDMTTPFDLIEGPLFRAHLFTLATDLHHLRLTGHHVVCDGWSMGMILLDLGRLYSGVPLPPAVALGDFAMAVRAAQHTPEHARVEQFWLDRFQGDVPRMDLPTDRPRPLEKTYAGARIDLEMPPALVRGLKEVATRNGATLVTTLLTSFEALLLKITGQRELVVGLPAAGQSDHGMPDLVAHCVNLLPLRSSIDPAGAFDQHLKRRRTDVLDAFDNQKYTFGTLVRKLNIPREAGRIPLVPVVFNVDMNMDGGVAFAGLQHRLISNPRHFENFELFLNVTGSEDRLVMEWSFNTDLFNDTTIRGWATELERLLERVITSPDHPIGELIGGTPPGHEEVPSSWTGQVPAITHTSSIGDLHAQVAARHGDRIAIEAGDLRMDHRTLHERVLAMAEALHAQGVRPGDRVGLSGDRCPELFIAMLAILHRGACFVPFDPGYPADRLRFMFEDTGVRLLLTQAHLRDQLPTTDVDVLLLEELPHRATQALPAEGALEAPAYIMYTSGSTGTPKGVVVPHRAILRLVHDQQFMSFGPDISFLQLSNISFDASTLEIWGALLNGGRLVLMPEQRPSIPEIIDTIRAKRVTSIWLTVGLFNLLVDERPDGLKGLRHVLTGGDVLSVPHVRKALQVTGPGVLINGYGPTENTTFTACHVIDADAPWRNGIPIGRPVNGTTVHVLDSAMRPVPVGEAGELYTGGNGVALGYWKREELTTERFVPDPFGPAGTLLYRTGDMVRWNEQGELEFLGRTDGQVKVRGFRIETGEVENALNDLASVKDRVVVVMDNGTGEKQLVCHVVPSDPRTEHQVLIEAVRKHLRNALPDHMVPTAFSVLERLPLTANGKVDKRALPRPQLTKDRAFVAPRNQTESELAALWRDVLGVDQVSVHDNFFDLGGHSLSGIQLLSKVEVRFGRKLPLKALFRSPTIMELALDIGEEGDEHHWTNLSAIRPDGDRTPLFCVHGDEANHFIPRLLEPGRPFYGFFHQGEDGRPLRYTTVEDIARHFIKEMREARPHGPYLLTGYSFGGLVAYEMACQLQAMGESVPFLGLFDTYAPHVHDEVLRNDSHWYDMLKKGPMRTAIRALFNNGAVLPMRLRHFNIIDTYDQAIARYRPGRFDGKIILFRAEGTDLSNDLGWGRHGDVEVVVVPGDHYTMIKEPAISTLVQRLENKLHAAEHQAAMARS